MQKAREVKILTIGANYASTQSTVIKGLKALGHEVKGLCFESAPSIYNDYTGITLPNFSSKDRGLVAQARARRRLRGLFLFLMYMRWAEVVHCFSDFFSTKSAADAKIVRFLKKKGFIEFLGSDIRQPEIELSENPYFCKAYYDMNYEYRDTESSSASLKRQSKFASIGFKPIAFDMFPFLDKGLFPRFFTVFRPCIVRDVLPRYPIDTSEHHVFILHVPTAPVAKGSRFIENAIERLKLKYRIDFRLVRNTSLDETLRLFQRCDIFIDQLIWGGYGVASQQAMAFGKPVVCYLKPVLLEKLYPKEIPVVNANIDTLESRLEELINNPKLRYELGVRSRKYVETYHDHIKVAENLINVYRTGCDTTI